jgi:hypothetical protein
MPPTLGPEFEGPWTLPSTLAIASFVCSSYIVKAGLSSRPLRTDEVPKPLDPRAGRLECSSVCDGMCANWLLYGDAQCLK